jgi:hypothetical protein
MEEGFMKIGLGRLEELVSSEIMVTTYIPSHAGFI